MRIINEPTAAAYAYSEKINLEPDGKPRSLLMFDFGGGTFDVTVLFIEEGMLDVLATRGDSLLGGRDIDNKIFDHCIEEFKTQGIDLVGKLAARAKLKLSCEQAKKTLSTEMDARILFDPKDGSDEVEIVLTRIKLEELMQPILNRCIEIVKLALEDAKFNLQDDPIKEVILVGGSSSIPKL